MTEHRDRMMAAFKSRFVPVLRERGFTGSFLHFRRRLAERLDLLNVQFYSAGGSFTINIARTGPDGFVAGPWAHLAVDEIEVGHAFRDRRRIMPRDAGRGQRAGGQFWEFGPRSTDDPRPAEPQSFYDAIAEDALARFLEEGEPWFERPEAPERGDEQAGPPGDWQPGDPWRFSRLLWHLRLRRPRMRIGVVIGGLEPELWRWENWRKIVPVMDALVSRLPRPVSILSGQMYEDGTGKQLPFGRMPWGEAGNRKWTTKYIEEGEGPVTFSQTEFWSPSRSEWAEKGGAPDFYARLDRDPYGEVQGFILALRRDVLRMEGVAEAADRTLAAVAEALPGSRTVINDRGWAEHNIGPVEIDPLDHTASELAHRFGEKRPWSGVEGFSAR
ncbi:MAG TPA: DUF4304 domain-containing protein [Allosphingosinicella sp.]